VHDLRTATSYFDPVWNAFVKQTDGSMKLIPEQIDRFGEDFHSQDTPITHLQGYDSMVKAFKESQEKDVQRLTTDRRCEAESKNHMISLMTLVTQTMSLSLSHCPLSQKSELSMDCF
jgi:hypothetical protein